jgi:hypothetical protein
MGLLLQEFSTFYMVMGRCASFPAWGSYRTRQGWDAVTYIAVQCFDHVILEIVDPVLVHGFATHRGVGVVNGFRITRDKRVPRK